MGLQLREPGLNTFVIGKAKPAFCGEPKALVSLEGKKC
jgi:hypothetical protein